MSLCDNPTFQKLHHVCDDYLFYLARIGGIGEFCAANTSIAWLRAFQKVGPWTSPQDRFYIEEKKVDAFFEALVKTVPFRESGNIKDLSKLLCDTFPKYKDTALTLVPLLKDEMELSRQKFMWFMCQDTMQRIHHILGSERLARNAVRYVPLWKPSRVPAWTLASLRSMLSETASVETIEDRLNSVGNPDSLWVPYMPKLGHRVPRRWTKRDIVSRKVKAQHLTPSAPKNPGKERWYSHHAITTTKLPTACIIHDTADCDEVVVQVCVEEVVLGDRRFSLPESEKQRLPTPLRVNDVLSGNIRVIGVGDITYQVSLGTQGILGTIEVKTNVRLDGENVFQDWVLSLRVKYQAYPRKKTCD